MACHSGGMTKANWKQHRPNLHHRLPGEFDVAAGVAGEPVPTDPKTDYAQRVRECGSADYVPPGAKAWWVP